MTKASSKTVNLQHVTEELNHDTGEIITTKKTFGVKVASVDEFIMTFVDFIAPIFKLKGEKDQKLLLVFMKQAEYNTGRITISTKMREDIRKELQFNDQNLSRSIASLKKNGLITGSKGEYFLNPKIFWKGSIAEREAYLKEGKHMEFTVRFSSEGNGLPDSEEFRPTEPIAADEIY